MRLSISIFRSLWILRKSIWFSLLKTQQTFNLHFQEPLNLTLYGVGRVQILVLFQSPFSGAFESYSTISGTKSRGELSISIFRSLWILRECCWECMCGERTTLSISIFRSLWILRSLRTTIVKTHSGDLFQSPFSGAFESYLLHLLVPCPAAYSFQSPFSGAFESYHQSPRSTRNQQLLSISIFRSLWILQRGGEVNG